ncbi:hypothetical protein C7212DRAFT_366292 [Tuber magnatum]|uniref:Uncharacterized protein n=1 Tax=Tuber magnatum TaxID=42249 RepID=A0A317SGS3_9PEZI|nr:hypothetical protein C7212DRAFT_366292 [Tuber magnatum]
MSAGLVHCEVDRNNSKTPGQNGREVVAEGLKNVIPTISLVQTGTYSSPETTDCKDADRGILSRLRKMEEKVNQLEALEAEVVMLRPLRKTTVEIRARFFATSRVQAGMRGIGLQASIDDGNEIAHGSDVVTDICLLKHGLIQYHQTFTHLYGMDWRAAMNLIDYPHLVEAMNYRAGGLHNNLGWTKQSEFDSVIA